MNTAGSAIRHAGLRAQAAENRARAAKTAATTAAGAAGVRQGSVPTELVDTRLLVKPRTFSGALADWTSRRFAFTACAGAQSPDMKRLMGRAVAADTDGEIFNVHLIKLSSSQNIQRVFFFRKKIQKITKRRQFSPKGAQN